MAKILPFQTRWERLEAAAAAEPQTELTPQERYQREYEYALNAVRDLTVRYKESPTWDPECEKLMVQVVQRLRTICLRITASKPFAPTPSMFAEVTTGETPNGA
jgi:hypothetical protein